MANGLWKSWRADVYHENTDVVTRGNEEGMVEASFSCYRLQPVVTDRDLPAGRDFSPLTPY